MEVGTSRKERGKRGEDKPGKLLSARLLHGQNTLFRSNGGGNAGSVPKFSRLPLRSVPLLIRQIRPGGTPWKYLTVQIKKSCRRERGNGGTAAPARAEIRRRFPVYLHGRVTNDTPAGCLYRCVVVAFWYPRSSNFPRARRMLSNARPNELVNTRPVPARLSCSVFLYRDWLVECKSTSTTRETEFPARVSTGRVQSTSEISTLVHVCYVFSFVVRLSIYVGRVCLRLIAGW